MAIVIKCDKCGCYLDEYRAKSIQFYATSSLALNGDSAVKRYDCCEACYNQLLEGLMVRCNYYIKEDLRALM